MTTPKFGDNAFVETCFNMCAAGADDDAVFGGEWFGLVRVRPLEAITLAAVPGAGEAGLEDPIVGFIVNEDDQGFVEVIPFEDEEDLEGVWEAIVEDEAEFFVNAVDEAWERLDLEGWVVENDDLIPQFWD